MNSIYLDYQATTPVDPRVLNSMLPYFSEQYGNPHSLDHEMGIQAYFAVRQSRLNVARAINTSPASITFTSGATEANNIALLGLAQAEQRRRRIVTQITEHSSVLEPLKFLRQLGFELKILPVSESGLVDLDLLAKTVDENTLLVSIMHVNNETGVIQRIREISQIAHANGAIFHSDCAQSFGRMKLDVEELDIDLMTISSHKAYGPKGIGALFIRKHPKIFLKPILYGGSQEQGIRPGTVSVPLCVGFGVAAEILQRELKHESVRIKNLERQLIDGLLHTCEKACLNGSQANRAPGTFNIQFPPYSSDELLKAFEGICVSSGSACTSSELEPSRVLIAYGLSKRQADSSLRFGIGRFTTERDIEQTLRIVSNAMTGHSFNLF